MLGGRIKQRGDTLIEVMFAFSIMSMMIVGAMVLMNRGVAASQRALETSVVRDEIDAQAETLRFLHNAYVTQFSPFITAYPANTAAGQWKVMTDAITATSASQFGGGGACQAIPSHAFILDVVNGRYRRGDGILREATGIPGVRGGATFTHAEGLWIEAIRGQSDQENTTYIDFHIRACWSAPGDGPPLTTGTIVRLYEPRQ